MPVDIDEIPARVLIGRMEADASERVSTVDAKFKGPNTA